jgi:hypothetical protein
MNVNPFGVKQSAPEASEQVAHFVRVKSTQGKLASVFKPLPIPAPPEVAVRYGWSSVA